jgi:alpha-amylase
MRKLLLLGVLIVFTTRPSIAKMQSPDSLPWWNDRVFYEIFVRSFYDSDGDGIGDLRGVIEKLDYLNDGDPNTTNDLGVTGIWLMPITESISYHGYDVTDYRSIERQYGSLDDMRALIEAAHERGIAVIIDLVLNHTSYLHPWFQSSLQGETPYSDWYVWADADPGFRGPDGQQVWHPYEQRFYYGVFWGGMPDLNLSNDAVTAELYDIARFWLQDVGIDGFRLDAVKHYIEDGETQENTPESLAWAAAFNAHTNALNPDALTIGEIWSNSFAIAPYVPDSVDLAFEFDLAETMVGSAFGRSRSGVASLVARAQELYPFGQYATFLTNHDQNRAMSELRGDVGAAKVAASFLLTTPGVPFLYYGEEIGMMGEKPDERIRTPMQWTDDVATAGFSSAAELWQPLADEGLEFNVAAQTGDPDSLLSHYRALIHLRNEHSALRRGTYTEVDSAARRVYAFLRQDADETLLVIINLDREPVSDYALTLDEGTLADVTTAAVLFGADAANIAAPTLNAAGGFEAYLPLPELAARGMVVIRLQ